MNGLAPLIPACVGTLDPYVGTLDP